MLSEELNRINNSVIRIRNKLNVNTAPIEDVATAVENYKGESDIYKVATLEQRDALNAKKGDACLVIDGGMRNMTAEDQVSKVTFPVTVTLPQAVTTSTYSMITAGSAQGDISLSASSFRIMFWSSGVDYNIYYTSTDGITYTGKYDVDGTEKDFKNTIEFEEFNELFGYFMQIDTTKMEGLFEYGEVTYNKVTGYGGKEIKLPAHAFTGYTTSCSTLVFDYTTDTSGIVNYYKGILFYLNTAAGGSELSGNYFYVDDNNNLYYRHTDTSQKYYKDDIYYDSLGLHRIYNSGTMPTGDTLIAENVDKNKIFIIGNSYYDYGLYVYNKDKTETIYKYAPAKTWTDIKEDTWINLYTGLSATDYDINVGKTALTKAGVCEGKGLPKNPYGMKSLANIIDAWADIPLDFEGTSVLYNAFESYPIENPKTYEAVLLALNIVPGTVSALFNRSSVKGVLDLSHCLNLNSAKSMQDMFLYCSGLTKVILPKSTTAMIDFTNTFRYCTGLTEIDMSGIVNGSATDTIYMFGGCTGLTKIDMRSFNFSNIDTSSCNGMFSEVPNNCLIIVANSTYKSWITSRYTNLTNVKTVAEYGA